MSLPRYLSNGCSFILATASRTGNSDPWAYRMKDESFEVTDCIDANLYLPCGSTKGCREGHIIYAESTITLRP